MDKQRREGLRSLETGFLHYLREGALLGIVSCLIPHVSDLKLSHLVFESNLQQKLIDDAAGSTAETCMKKGAIMQWRSSLLSSLWFDLCRRVGELIDVEWTELD